MRTFRFLSVLFLASAAAFGQTERIRGFDSQITVHADGTLDVQETIQVVAAGSSIVHGIYRDFPTEYKDRQGNNYHVDFTILGLERDGNPEPYHTASQSNGIRIYFGSSTSTLSDGPHRYQFIYRVNRELGFFPDHDELYWNVTGNGWQFPIDLATATVIFPSEVKAAITSTDGYTGYQGDKEKRFTFTHDTSGNPRFAARNLGPKQGLSIVVTWPKGLIAEPTNQQKLAWFAHDNRAVIAAAIGVAVLLLYYLLVWTAVGRDPKAGTIVPLYEPPSGLSPAAVRYLEHMAFDQKAFTAAILDLAARGYLTIECNTAGVYTLHRKPGYGVAEKNLTSDEKGLADALFAEGGTLVLKQDRHSVMQAAQKALQTALHNAMEKTYFVTNSKYLWPGILITIATVGIVLLIDPSAATVSVAFFMTIWLSVWTFAVYALLSSAVRSWKSAIQTGSWLGAGGALYLSLFCLPFLFGEGFGIYMLYRAASAGIFIGIGTAIVLNVIFHHLLKAPTRLGRQLLDRIDGFKMFLGSVEGDRLNRAGATVSPVAKTPQLFERYLSYALALGVEHAWAEQFTQVMAAAAASGSPSSSSYAPSWYSGPSGQAFSPTGFTSSFSSSFSGAIASSSTSLGSSSGGGGGGSSGGGGGGGGGGGW